MKSKLVKLFLINFLLFASCLTFVESKGINKKDVWWEKDADPSNGGGVWKAYIMKTNNEVVHEWRYEWNGEEVNVHMIYKPVTLFPNQPGGKWILWNFDDRYSDLLGDEGDLEDYFTRYEYYWVMFNRAVY